MGFEPATFGFVRFYKGFPQNFGMEVQAFSSKIGRLVDFCIVSGTKCDRGWGVALYEHLKHRHCWGRTGVRENASNYVQIGSVRCELCHLLKSHYNSRPLKVK